MKIEIEKINGIFMLSSWDFYKILALHPATYNKWIQSCIINKGVKDKDYFNFDNWNYSTDKNKRVRIRLHLNIDFAIGITIRYDTLLAKSLRRELINIRDSK